MAVSSLAPSACCSRRSATRRCIFSANGSPSSSAGGGAPVAVGRQHMVVSSDFLKRGASAEARLILVSIRLAAPAAVDVGDPGDVTANQFPFGCSQPCCRAHGHRRLAPLRAGPAACGRRGCGRGTRGMPGSVWSRTVGWARRPCSPPAGFDEVASDDLAVARLVRGYRAVGEHGTGGPRRRKVMDDVLQSGEVGIAFRRDPVLAITGPRPGGRRPVLHEFYTPRCVVRL